MNLQTAFSAVQALPPQTASDWSESLRLDLMENRTDWVLLNHPADPSIWRDGIDGFHADGSTVCFRAGDSLGIALRQLFLHRVLFVGAAPSLQLCTLEAIEAIRAADVCLHDTLFDPDILKLLKPTARIHNVGKRCGKHAVRQLEINQMLLDYTRMGLRVVRLKAGDPGIYGRLCEETDALTQLGLPFHVQPAVSSLSVATTGTGLLLTRRGLHRGFTVMTPRCAGGQVGELDPHAMDMPIVLFMASHIVRDSLNSLLRNGLSPDTPAAIIYDAGTPQEEMIEGTATTLPELLETLPRRTGLVYIGQGAAHGRWPKLGPLAGETYRIPKNPPPTLVEKIHDLGASIRNDESLPEITHPAQLEAEALNRIQKNFTLCSA
ncbi:MAG: SAM-dependent methyltransferase [Puniceicoccales bacterium]